MDNILVLVQGMVLDHVRRDEIDGKVEAKRGNQGYHARFECLAVPGLLPANLRLELDQEGVKVVLGGNVGDLGERRDDLQFEGLRLHLAQLIDLVHAHADVAVV